METKNAEMQQVMERLERVERQNRWLVRGGVAFVLACGSVLLMAQKPLVRTIEAEKFVLKDAAGKVGAELHMTESGPELAFYSGSQSIAGMRLGVFKNAESGLSVVGGQGNSSVLLGVGEDGPGLALLGKGPDSATLTVGKGGSNLWLGGTGEGDANVELSLDKGKAALRLRGPGPDDKRVVLDVGKDGPGLVLSTGEGKGIAALSVSNDEATLALRKGGAGAATLTAGKDQTHLWLFGPSATGIDTAYLSVDKDGPNLLLKDLEGFQAAIGNEGLVSPTTGEKLQTSAASIHLADPKGKILWSAP